MPSIHLIERSDNVRKTDRNSNEWESGHWAVPENVAQSLIGGSLFLHRSKQQPSHFGGKITAYRIEESGPSAGLVVFKLRAQMDGKDVKTDRKGWTKDLKIVADETVPEHV